MSSRNNFAARGFSLVEMLVVIVLIAAMGAALMNFYAGKGKPGEKRRSPVQRARGVECAEYLRQNRMAIDMQKNSDEESRAPATLGELRLGTQAQSCPEGKVPYSYDPATGVVRCPYPGHEKL